MSIDLRTRIVTALHAFIDSPLAASSIELLNALGYHSDRRLALSPNTGANFERTFSGVRTLNQAQARIDEWTEANFLLQLTDDEVAQTEQLHLLRERDGWNSGVYRSFAFLAIGLAGERYSRTVLATITRAVNRLFAMPTPIFFRYGDKLTLAIIIRRPGKRDTSKDVLEKVTLIKDIDLRHPHAAHIRILEDLALANLRQGQSVGNFDELQNAWAKTLDISELNKRFYQELANWYYWAVDTVTFPQGASQDDEETRNAVNVIRMITRLIFVWFIKEKGLVPDELFERNRMAAALQDLSDDGDSYYKAILQNLFFATLNTEMNTAQKPQSRIFHSEDEFQGRNRHYGVPNVYRYARMFAIDQPSALALFATIPFLNGGLFECLDRPDQGIRIDGFSDRADNPLHVPNVLFFGNARSLDLNEVFGTRNKQYQVRGLFEIFHRYKFTIEENTPIDEEVALDPELLGKVFENLLAAYNPETRTTARKQTGSFYTPREIVDYMVDEALIAYLAATLRQHAALAAEPDSQLEARLRHLFAYTDESHQFTADEVMALIDAIDRIKILDPACGSGAFPMGVLHKLVFILRKLDPNNIRWKEQQLARVQRDRLLAEQMEDEKNREHAIKEIDERIHDIEHSFAEQDHELDYTRKLYLIENCIYGVDIQPIAVQIAKLRFFISLVADQRVDDTAPNRNVRALPNLETKFVAANTLIGLQRGGQMTLRNPEIDRLEEDLRHVRQRHFTARTTATKKKYRGEDARLRQRIGELLKQDGWPDDMTKSLARWDPYDQNAHADFFDPEWMFGVTEGYSVVIGNPPWVSLLGKHGIEDNMNSKDKYLSLYDSNTYMPNLYELFLQRGLSLTMKYGHLCFILPDRFGFNESSANLRKRIVRENAILQIVYKWEFASVIVDTMTLLIRRGASNHSSIAIRNRPDEDPLKIDTQQLLSSYDCVLRGFSDISTKNLIEKIQKRSFPLNKFARSTSGFGGKSAKITPFRISENQIQILKGASIHRYAVIKHFYFDFRDENLTGRTRDTRKLGQRAKVLLRKTGNKIIAAYDESGMYPEQSLYFLFDIAPEINPRYLLGILNSTLISWYYLNCLVTNADSTPQLKNYDLDSMPIILSDLQQPTVVKLVDHILAAKSQNPTADVSALEAEIDQLVYRLYGLTEEEIGIVEGNG